jgi:MerR family transcriptional regulator, aldehyde-responsive regulator
MTIAEVSKKYELSPDTLRYYERVGLIPSVSRSSGGIRNYSEEDCKWIDFAKCMRSAGLSIEVLIEYVALFQQGDATIEDRKRLLKDERDRLAARVGDMQKTLDRLNYKIERYEQSIIPIEKGLK